MGISYRTLRRRLGEDASTLGLRKASARERGLVSLLCADVPFERMLPELGFGTFRSLARYVKRTYGTTPTQFREFLFGVSTGGARHESSTIIHVDDPSASMYP
jgi:hypothetical protein